MKILKGISVLAVLTVFSSCKEPDYTDMMPDLPEIDEQTPVQPPVASKNYIVNGDLEDDIPVTMASEAVAGEWRYIGGWNPSAAKVAHEQDRGVDGSRCLSIIALEQDTDVMFAQKVTGLKPGGYYRASAKVKTDMVTGGKGANICQEYLWSPASDGVVGSVNKWKTITVDVDDVPQSGEITLCLRLGNTAASSKGLVYFDDVKLMENDELYIRESKHLRLVIDKTYKCITDEVIDQWLANLDKVYECYEELFSGMVPFEGKITTIRAASIDAWAYAGNPIKWNRNYIETTLAQVNRGDWCFGLMHEIGHNFAPYINNATYTFDWNEELFANFRMFYALEKLNATVITTASIPQPDGTYKSQEKTYVGARLLDLYQSETDNCYERTIAAGRSVEMGNALCYKLIKIKEKYGWDLYKKAFADLYKIPRNEEEEKAMNNWQKFEYFMSFLTKHAGENVMNTCFTPVELNTIKTYLEKE